MDKITLFATSSTGKPKQWAIWTEDGYVCQEWGFVDGKKTSTKDLVKQKNIGKSNETSLSKQAELEAERKLTKKKEEGYSESLSTSNVSEIDWSNGKLPSTFGPSKPETSIDDKLEQEILDRKQGWYTRKFNGYRTFVVRYNNGVKIYSRKIEDKTENFPHHVADIVNCPWILPGTILDCEFCLVNSKTGKDDPDLIKEVYGSKPEKSIERQNTTHGIPFAKVFDILYLNKQQYTGATYIDRYVQIQKLIPDSSRLKHFSSVKILNAPGKKYVAPPDWEGLIFADGESTSKIRFDGKVSRDSGLYKKKSFKECDLICKSWEYGKGRLNNDVATLNLGAYDKHGKYIDICQSGSGLTDELRDVIKKKSPYNKFVDMVFEIKYEEKTPKGSLRLPIILRLREDKSPKECVLSDIK